MYRSDKLSLVIQSFGCENEYRRSILSIWSFYAHVSPQWEDTNVLLFTDKQEFFKGYLQDLPVTYIMLTSEKMREMRGEIDFLHRMKIAIIEEALNCSEGNIVYIDSDTFFTGDPASLFARLRSGVSFMHTREYAFQWLQQMPLPSGAPFRAVLKLLGEKYFVMANREKKKFSPALFSWNAGVIMLHREQQYLLPDVYAITDQLYRLTKNHSCEQYAFSIMLQTSTRLYGCQEYIYHYWYRVKKQIIDRFLENRIDSSWNLLRADQKKQRVRKWTRKLPAYFDSHLLTVRDNSIQAFNRNDFIAGYGWALKAFVKNPFDPIFIKDFLYHTKRHIFHYL